MKTEIGANFYEGLQTEGFPKTTPTKTDASPYTSRFFNVSITKAKSLEVMAELRDDYFYKTTAITQSTNAAWANAYAIYSGGDTKIWIASNTPTVGGYLKINAVFYKVSAKNGNEITVKDLNGN